METIELISLALGVTWASGINLYAAVLTLGYLSLTGNLELPPGLEALDDPMVMGAAGLMYCVEFFADKTPGIDTGWDAIHTFIRIPAGAVMAASMAQGLEIGPAAEFAALLVGGGITATSHVAKASSRLLINTSPEPVTNWTASITEDLAVIGGLWTALNYPIIFICLLVLFALIVIWILPRIWRTLKALFQRIGAWFSGRKDDPTPSSIPGQTRRDILKTLYHDARDNPNK